MSSISSIGSDSTMQQLMAQMYTKMSKADTDGTSGLSKSELSSIDTSGDAGGGAFLQSLSNQFSTLDSDQDGQLSSDEISQAQPVQPQDAPLGPPPGMNVDSTDSDSTSTSDVSGTSSTSTDNSYSSLLDSLLKSVMNTFDTNGDGKISQDEISSVLGNSGSSSTTDSSSMDATSTDTSGSVASMGPPPGPPMGPPPSDSSVNSTTDTTSVDAASTSTTSADKFLKDFIKHYDTNEDGKVSMDEFESVFNSEQNSANAGDSTSLADASSSKPTSESTSSDSSKSDFGEELKNLSSKFLQKLIDSYNNTSGSGFSSALSSLV